MDPQIHSPLTIGALAKLAGVPVDTLRHYERESLLPQPQRGTSGYRLYDKHALERVRFIRRAKDLGFTLDEIRDLLALSHDREHGVEGVKRRANERLIDINRRIEQLSVMRDRLTQLVNACPGHGEPECCPILNDIHGHQAPAVAAPERSCCGGAVKEKAEQRS
jgi:MerR family transcriptional regulator, copper efflux regulator